jgi:hypothetical protein
MRMSTFAHAAFWIAVALLFCLPSPVVAQPPEKLTPEQAREEIAYTLGVQAYLWGFPLQYYGTVIPESLKVGGSDLNAFRRFTALKTAKDRFVVSPNNVTIDAYANFDVTAEPVVVFVPTLSEPRWYLVQMGDTFDEVFRNVGGTKGSQPGVYVITGPDFKGEVPGDMIRIPTRTKIGVMAVRIFANGDLDLPKAVEAQKGFHLMPLSAYVRDGLAYKPPKTDLISPFKSEAPEGLRFFDELGAQLSDQVTYPNTRIDDKGEAFTGERKYVLHFEKGKLPPVSVFWNLAMYTPDMFFVENEFKRFSLGSTTDGLKKNDDGSLTLYIQKDRPEGDRVSNWLPSPTGAFNMTMRFYGPEPSVLDGTYRLPAVRRADAGQK